MRAAFAKRRRRRSDAKRQALLKYKQTAPTGIGLTRKTLKGRKDRALERQIRKTHDLVWARDAYCRVSLLASDDDQMHEDPPRSKTRGLPPDQRFNTNICIRLRPEIHELVTHNEITLIQYAPAVGFNGPIGWECHTPAARKLVADLQRSGVASGLPLRARLR